MTTLTERLDRTVSIRAPRATVFQFFTDPVRWAAWWGAGSTIDARPGGRVLIRYPDGTEAVGEVVEATPPDRLIFTYGYAKGTPIPPGASRVTIRLEPEAAGTRLQFTHEFADARVRDAHVQGWRYQLSLFANVVANEVNKDAARLVDDWFAAWAERDEARRAAILARIATPDVRTRDRFSVLDGLDDLGMHIAAAQRFMPGIAPRRRGDVRHCLGVLLVDWAAEAPDGAPRGSGTSVFVLAADGRIESVTGFWA